MSLSGYRAMWLFVMFDLPTDTKKARKRYTQFRTRLLHEGFTMMQYSVYARYCASEESSTAIRQRIRVQLPPDGHVRLFSITDRQFGKMDVFFGKSRESVEQPPPQLMLF